MPLGALPRIRGRYLPGRGKINRPSAILADTDLPFDFADVEVPIKLSQDSLAIIGEGDSETQIVAIADPSRRLELTDCLVAESIASVSGHSMQLHSIP